MMTFWIVAGVLTALALLTLLPSLLGKSKAIADIDRDALNAAIARERLANLEAEFEQGTMDEPSYQAARDEIERGLLDDVDFQGERAAATGGAVVHWTPIVIAVLIPAMAIWVYLQLGDPAAVERLGTPAQANGAANPHAGGGAQAGSGPAGEMPPIAELADKLAARLEQEPDNVEGWTMLARTYDVLERYADAASAYEMALSLTPEDPDLMVNLAEALAMTADGNLQGQPRELIDRAHALNPTHGKTLWYAGMARYQTGNEFEEAVDLWMQLLVQMDESTEAYQQVAEIVRDAAAKGGFEAPLVARLDTLPSIEAPAASAPADSTVSRDGAAAASLEVSVRLAEGVANRVQPGDTLFVYAKAVSGPPMPLAIVRVTAADLPFQTVLDDSQAMMAQMRLSNFPEVTVGARVSRSGQAMAQPGDVFGEVSPVAVGDGVRVDILIDQVK